MKVCIITRSMLAGGAERVIAQLVKYMTMKNVDCKIITLNDQEVFYDLPKQVGIYAIGEKSDNKYLDKYLKYRELRHIIKKFKPDVVLALPEEIGIYVIPALIGTNIPVVVSERNNPWVMPWKKETRLLRRIFYPLAAGFVFQTDQAASYFSQNIRKKSIVLPNPLDLERIPEQWKGDKRKEIVAAGRFEEQKNFPLLIKAFAKFHESHDDYHLTIYGDGSLREELETLASSLLPKEAYSFPGKTSELLEYINGATMFVLSSDYEGLPNVVIEAMAMGIPVVSTDCPSGGPAELINNEVNGLLVQVGNIEEMAMAMSKVAGDPEFAAKLGFNSTKIKTILNSNNVAEQWRKYLEEFTQKK
jgi:glycosyltransferase involved in cell wall biosynthesis